MIFVFFSDYDASAFELDAPGVDLQSVLPSSGVNLEEFDVRRYDVLLLNDVSFSQAPRPIETKNTNQMVDGPPPPATPVSPGHSWGDLDGQSPRPVSPGNPFTTSLEALSFIVHPSRCVHKSGNFSQDCFPKTKVNVCLSFDRTFYRRILTFILTFFQKTNMIFASTQQNWTERSI